MHSRRLHASGAFAPAGKKGQQQFGPGETLQGILHSETGLVPGGTALLVSSGREAWGAHAASMAAQRAAAIR